MTEIRSTLLILNCIFAALGYDQFVVPKTTIAYLSSTLQGYPASNAVDGNFSSDISSCSHTDVQGQTDAWLFIDLQNIYSVQSVKFWYRNSSPGRKRLPGYSIRVSNDSTTRPPKFICYQDKRKTISETVITNDCKSTGQFVWVYQNNTKSNETCPILEICEIQVFGCETGIYGKNCNHSCSHCMNKNTCDIESGKCDDWGCARENFSLPLCTNCSTGIFGADCDFQCSEFCRKKSCHRTTGTCLHGCETGYNGTHCNQTCPFGMFGEECSQTCGRCLSNVTCNPVNGKCSGGCDEGYMGSYCDTPCYDGQYGKNCNNNCTGNCFNNEVCDSKDGSCSNCTIGYQGKICDTLHANLIDQTNGDILAGSISSIVVFAIVCIAVFVMVLRWRKRKQVPTRPILELFDTVEQDTEKDQPVESSQDLAEYYNSLEMRSGSINIADLIKVIHTLENDKQETFEKEFKSIPYGELPDVPCTVGKLPENLPKNRFKTTFPYDHSRIVLQSSSNTNYINANYIKDTLGRIAYIASQGPKPNTVNDFVQMVWQEDVAVIAMVTSCKEGDTVKCEAYWPTKVMQKVIKGMYIIQLLSEKEYSNFMIRQLNMTSKELNTSRQIVQLQYTMWPDHGIPSPLDLLVYYQYVSRAMEKHLEHKLLVHCSAGVGRTGTFIALDALYRQGMKEGKINIVEYVNTMREDRMNMVQNANQYRFLYHVLYKAFQSHGTVQSKYNFTKEVEYEMSSIKAVNMSRLRKEFMDLCSIKPVFTEDETKFGVLNLHLNMTKSILPADNMRIILSSYVAGRGSYYNAVPLSTFTMRDCFIAAQYPVPGAGVDFIRLLVDQDCSTLVSVNPLSEVPSANEWFPISDDCNSMCPYAIRIEHTDRLSEHFCKYVLTMRATTNNDWHKVHVYEMTTWGMEDVLPSTTNVLLEVVKAVQHSEKVDPEHKIAIASRDGATGCGVFCAVYNAIQQLQQDEEVDMFTIVRQLQSRRPEMISNLNEYLFICQTVAEYINSSPDGFHTVPDVGSCKDEENIYANT
ncbi:receptor-type tyrosine-protein phosphatase alpha-like [Crassostrea virginica]